MVLHIGTDEAGYGPLLGPLVVAAAVFVGGAEERGRFGGEGVDDSKRVYGRGGRDALARALSPFLGPFTTPLRLSELMRSVSVRGDPRGGYDWYGEVRDGTPVAAPPPVGFGRLYLNPVCEAEFNAGCRAHRGKAGLLFHETMRVLRTALADAPDVDAEVICDKHGGRHRYAALLMGELSPSSIVVERESRERSVYRLRIGGRPVRVSFLKQADGHDAPAALASMAAKYTRELFMDGFNAYFARHVDGLRPTAGYYEDGKRFLSDIAPAIEALGIDRSRLVRDR